MRPSSFSTVRRFSELIEAGDHVLARECYPHAVAALGRELWIAAQADDQSAASELIDVADELGRLYRSLGA